MTSLAQARYAEFVPPGLQSIWDAAKPLGFGLSGMLADDDHTYGGHLSAARLKGTKRPDDYTLTPPPGTQYERACAAIDLGTGPVGNGPEWSGEWLESVRRRCQSGEIGFVGEIIGDPDLIPGPAMDAHVHMYASAKTAWTWVPYQGSGHVAWCHLWILRNRLGDASLGTRLFDGWGKEGEDEDMDSAEVERIVRAMDFRIPNHTYTKLDRILPALSSLADRNAGEGRKALIREVRDAVIAELRNGNADPT